ncbi:hypothetical protein [Desulfogranum japonicum]|uniref:hypothetical protein n=1 Tax=Desulfogranum japonicum TaxID=231447 RepID=UPI0004237470|nr:hypothetical protein [Desulfogranum japonicum]
MKTSLQTDLTTLNELLVRERAAITHLQMQTLDGLQQKKAQLLNRLQEYDQPVDEETKKMIQRIQKNNERNRALLKSGLALLAGLQKNVFRKLALTYAAQGKKLHIDNGPRILERSA